MNPNTRDGARANIRDAFGTAIAGLGGEVPELVVLTDDLMYPTRTDRFGTHFPERMINVGNAEQNMVGIAAGLATAGFLPLIASYSAFLCLRAVEQVRDDIAYTNLNVKLAGLASGLTAGTAGPTHQTYEDVAILRAMPNMTVVVPSDAYSTGVLTRAALFWGGPVFLRLGRDEERVVHEADAEFEIGRAVVVRDGTDVALIANGPMVAEACDAANYLEGAGIQSRVIEMHTVKPIDAEAILGCARDLSAIVTIEEHSVHGGLGSAVLEVLQASPRPPVTCLGIADEFPPIGPTFELRARLGLDARHIADAAVRALKAEAPLPHG